MPTSTSETITVVQQDLPEDLVASLRSESRIGCDIETTGLDWRIGKIGSFQLHAQATGTVVVRVGPSPKRLTALIADPTVSKVFHHAPFDLGFIAAHWAIRPANVACTKIASKILEPTLPPELHTLQSLTERHLGITISKGQERVSNWLAPTLTDAQLAYAAADVRHLLPLLDHLCSSMTDQQLELFQACLEFLPTRTTLEIGEYPDIFVY